MEKTTVHPYCSVNLKREDIKSFLYDAIELPWGYSFTNAANCRIIQSRIRSVAASTRMSSRGRTLKEKRKW